MSLQRWLTVLGTLCMLAAPATGMAQATWPSKPVRLIVGYAPGGGTDVAARIFATQLSQQLGQAVVVENRPGATGRIGTNLVARSTPDGYTLLFGTSAELTIAPVTTAAMTYDPLKDLEPISQVGWLPNMLVASSSFPPNTLTELIAYAKAHPGKINYGSGGQYSQPHLIGLRFNLAAGIDTVHVPYKGSGPMISDLIAGQIQYSFSSPQPMVDLIKSGKLKAISVLSPDRLATMPTVPTMAQAGLPGFVDSNWVGLLAPHGTPHEVVARLHAATVAALKSTQLQKAFGNLYILPIGGSPDELLRFMKAEVGKYRELAAAIGLKPE